MTDLLRSFDPAARVTVDPYASDARVLLRQILAQPRNTASRKRHRAWRLVLAPVAAGVAAIVVFTVPMPWKHGASGLTTAAYAVTQHSDGSTSVVVHWSDIKNPAALQAELDRVQAPVRVLTGVALPDPKHPQPVPACAEPTSGQPYSAKAVQWDFPNQATPINGFVIHPSHFPSGGTLVIEVYYEPGASTPISTLSYMAIGHVPTCAQPAYDMN